MKIQCACGAKYAFDVTPDMVRNPVKLVCQNCGADNSTVVNQLIQQQFGAPSPAPSISVPGVGAAARVAPAPEIAPPPAGARVVPLAGIPSAPQAASVAPAAPGSSAPPAPPRPGAPSLRVSAPAHEPPAEKPSAAPAPAAPPPAAPRYPLPKQRHGEGRYDKLLGRGLAAAFALFFAGLGFWGWYAWVGSVPKAYASLRIEAGANSGQLHMQPGDQAVFLHGSKLVRHDFKEGKELWSVQLVDDKLLEKVSKEEFDRYSEERSKGAFEFGSSVIDYEDVLERHKRSARETLRLHARGDAVWISSTNKLTRYDWQSGRVTSEVELAADDKQLVENGDEILVRQGNHSVLTVNLLSGESKKVEAGGEPASEPAGKPSPKPTAGTTTTAAASTNASRSAAGTRRPGTINRIAAPAVNAANENQRRLGAELAGTTGTASPSRAAGAGSSATSANAKPVGEPTTTKLVATRHGTFHLAARFVGQRSFNGENASVFTTTLRKLGAGDNAPWVGDMPGIADIYGLPSGALLSAGRFIIAIDASGKKKWEQKLESGLRVISGDILIRDRPQRDEGPCLERDGIIYLAESSGLIALDAASGTPKWRLACNEPSTMVFDQSGNLYLNTVTSGGGGKAEPAVQKVEIATGKTLWSIDREGAATYCSGKFLYTIDSYRGDLEGKEGIDAIPTVLDVGPFVRLRRIDMETGKVKWSHVQQRFPLDVRIENNTFQILFKKELQLLKFMSF